MASLKRPSSRRKGASEQVNLNLVPILDTLVTLIAFLLFTMSFIALVSIESPFPETSADSNNEKFKERPLQLTVSMQEKEVRIWSPFERIEAKSIAYLPDGTPDFKAVHDHLITIKQKFPTEKKIVFAPTKNANYEVLILMMDAMRLLEKTDPTIAIPNKQTGVDEILKELFPDVIFGNLLSNT